MKRKFSGVVVLLAACWALAASCARDDRDVQLAFSLTGGDAGADASIDPTRDGAPRIEVGPSSIDLGWVTVGHASRTRVRVTNAGGAPASAPRIDWSSNASGDFEIIQNQCLTALAPGASCEVRVEFIPAMPGEASAVLHVESDAGVSDVDLRGLGLAAGDLILAPALGSFENFGGLQLGATAQGLFTISNPSSTPSGPLAIQLNRPEFVVLPAGGAATDCVVGTTSLVNGQSCNIAVAFTPIERGPIEATFTSRSDAVGSVSLTLTGQGLLPATLAASSTAIDFDGVVLADAAQRGVTFQNQGDEPLTLAGATLAPAGAEGFAIVDSDCGAGRVLAAGESCSVQVEFRPPRSGEVLAAELVTEASAPALRQAVSLRGIGLEPGALLVSTLAAGDDNFGPVLLESSLIRTFQITNPGTQPSGVMTFTASEGFELQRPPAEGECVPESTSLVDGQSCSVRVRFTPARRGAYRGSLTVNSALAGAKSLPLSGRGIVTALLAVAPEINFGRVFTNAPTSRTLTVENTGDEPLSPPGLELTSTSAELAAAFSYQSACMQPLAFGESCEINIGFAPNRAGPHSANLKLTSEPGGTSTVLLLAEALAPGSLVLEAQGGSADFGDVAIGTTSTRSFTLANPGSAGSGRITIRSDNNRFQPVEGDCNAEEGGLVGGSSCTFSVAFAPETSLPVVGNLSVQSPGAGQIGLELRGRGRAGAALAATGNRDLGRANIGQSTLTAPENEFTWTVNNSGDLPSGALTLTNSNATEFEPSNDTCTNAQVPGGGTCQVALRFRPSDTGVRRADIVVTDPSTGLSTTLALTGTGVRLAQLGQSCVTATCAAGTCTRGVCCDRACEGSCQFCSAAGVCTDQDDREACGNGDGRCFGVNRCLLPEGEACGQDGDCGLANCERRLGGSGANDRLCCAADCSATGQQCNAQGQCQQPTLSSGALCGRVGDPPCGGNLECKGCSDGARRCTEPDLCCGGCSAPYVCIDGDRCGCPLQADGQRMIDCTGGLCIQNRGGACCSSTAPLCSGVRSRCDLADNLCKECLTATDCPGANRACNAGTCGCAANTRACSDGRCIGNNQCCESCTGGRTCQASTGNCVCPGTQQFINGQCRLNLGDPCTPGGTPCNGICAPNGVCCESACNGDCMQCQSGTGRCLMPANDSDCEPVDCPTPSNPCQTSADINTNLCQALGQCKTTAQCTVSSRAARTVCGEEEAVPGADGVIAPVCDGSGTCRTPTIACLDEPVLEVSPRSCCVLPNPAGASIDPIGPTTVCGPGVFGTMGVFCDGQNDCPAGTSCCASDFGNFNYITCQETCPEDGSPGVSSGTYLVCRSPGGGSSPCPGGRACNRVNPDVTGWTFCALP